MLPTFRNTIFSIEFISFVNDLMSLFYNHLIYHGLLSLLQQLQGHYSQLKQRLLYNHLFYHSLLPLLQQLQGQYSQLKQRLLSCDLEDFGMDRDAEWAVNSSQVHSSCWHLMVVC